MKIFVRKMVIEDLPAVVEIDNSSFPNPWPMSSYQYELVENENSRAWVSEIQENSQISICAMAVLWKILDEIHIGTIAVNSKFRGLGIGTHFLGILLNEAKKEGILNAYLEVRETNMNAQKMYEKFNFRIDGIRKKYYRDNGENAILMSTSLLDNQCLDAYDGYCINTWIGVLNEFK